MSQRPPHNLPLSDVNNLWYTGSYSCRQQWRNEGHLWTCGSIKYYISVDKASLYVLVHSVKCSWHSSFSKCHFYLSQGKGYAITRQFVCHSVILPVCVQKRIGLLIIFQHWRLKSDAQWQPFQLNLLFSRRPYTERIWYHAYITGIWC